MAGLELEPLNSGDADAYFRAFVAGRTDLPTTDVTVQIDRYLALPLEEQRTFLAFKEGGRIVGTVRLAGSAISFFSIHPEERRWTRDAILEAVNPLIASGSERITATFDDSYAEDFRKLGFEEWFSRMRMEAPTVNQDPPRAPMSHPEAMDVHAMTDFLMAVYEGHIEQAFGIHSGSPEVWREYVTGIWKGDSGAYLPLASWQARDEQGIAGVCLTTLWMGTPLVAELGVRKDRRGQGLGRALMTAAMSSLIDLGHDRLALYVTLGNDPAIRLYESLGFRQVGGRSVTAVREL